MLGYFIEGPKHGDILDEAEVHSVILVTMIDDSTLELPACVSETVEGTYIRSFMMKSGEGFIYEWQGWEDGY